MEEKEKLLIALTPIAALQALTAEAFAAIPQQSANAGIVGICRFPFRIGRESRVQRLSGKIERIERRPRLTHEEPTNDLYLVDRGHLLNISREHLWIDRSGDEFILVDRGSSCGTKINEVSVGGKDQGGSAPLQDGDIITVGTKESQYRFRFIDFSMFEIRRQVNRSG